MAISRRFKRSLIGVALGAVVNFAMPSLLWAQDAPTAPVIASAPALPADSLYALSVPLIDAQGRSFDFQELAGKPLLVTMFYGDCTVACPIIMQNLQRTMAEVKPQVGQLSVLMVSLNPEHDNSASLLHLSQKHQLDEQFFRLAVSIDDGHTRALAAALKIKYRLLENGEISHNTRVVLLDARGQVLAASTQLQATPDPLLVKEIRQALQ
ncbi:MAG: SCO family protein [Pseudomonadaceae bacterium]|jgi:protein SCO1/2|nr:SCO family protein [Pseudomonadaceae bacterium]